MPDPLPVDLDALDEFLMSDRAPDDSMGLSDLDGYLTGIVVGPEMIMPSGWLPVIWGGEEPAFENISEARSSSVQSWAATMRSSTPSGPRPTTSTRCSGKARPGR